MSTAIIGPESTDVTPWRKEDSIGAIEFNADLNEFTLIRLGCSAIVISDTDVSAVENVVVLAHEYELQQVWIMPSAARALDLPEREDISSPPSPHPWGLFEMTDARIEPTHGGLTRWYKVEWTTEPRGRVSVVLPHLDNDTKWKDARDAVELLHALDEYKRATGSYFFWSVGSTASGLASKNNRSLRYGTRVNETPYARCDAIYSKTVPLIDRDSVERYSSPVMTTHVRSLTDEERKARTLFGWDVNAQYLGAIRNAWCGRGEPVHIKGHILALADHTVEKGDTFARRLINGKIPGYYRLANYPHRTPEMQGLPALRFRKGQDQMWVTSSLLEFLLKQKAVTVSEICEAWAWPLAFQPFEGFGEALTAARSHFINARDRRGLAGCETIAFGVLKDTYSQFYGWLGRRDVKSESGLWRPDWSHIIADLAKVNLWRKIVQIANYTEDGQVIGSWPVATQADQIWYVSDADTHKRAQPLGMLATSAVGTFKPYGWAALTPFKAADEARHFFAAWREFKIEGER